MVTFGQQKECSNQKIEENKSGLEFNFLLKSTSAQVLILKFGSSGPISPSPNGKEEKPRGPGYKDGICVN